MNDSILTEIGLLRGNRNFIPDYKNSNRYSLIVREQDNSRTVYCFGVPIYSKDTRKLVSLSFEETLHGFYHKGSNAEK